MDPLPMTGEATAQASPAVALMRASADARKRQLDQIALQNQYKQAEEARMKTQGDLANARESRIATQDRNAQDTQTMGNDLAQWSQDSTQPQYRVSWDQAPAEVKSHVASAYPNAVAAAPHIWNNSVTANTGVITGQPAIPATPAIKLQATKAGVEVLPTDTADDLVAKMHAKQEADAAPPNNGAAGEAALEGMNPDEANMVRQIANYDLPSTALSRLPPAQKLRILGRVSQFDPAFSANEYPARQSLKTSVKAGPISENIKAANTAVAHLNTLLEASKALNNGKFPILNTVGNWVGAQTGSAAPANFDTARNAVVGELSKVFKGSGVVPQSEINHWREVMNSSQSPEQIKGAVQQALELMGGRFGAIQDQYERGMGRPKDFSILTPKSRAILRSNGFDPDSIETGTAPAQEALPNSANAQAPAIPPAAVQHLQQHPELAPYFEQKYGQGSSTQYLRPTASQ